MSTVSRAQYEYHQPEDPTTVRAPGFKFGARHVQCFMAFLGIATTYCVRIHLSVAIVSMTQKSSSNENIPVLPWDSRMRGTILSAFFWSYLFILIPSGQLAEKFGPKRLFVIAMFISGVVMVLTPYAAIYGGFYWMIITRLLLGATQAVTLPSTHFLLSKWTPLPERGMLLTFVFTGLPVGNFLTLTLAGVLADSPWGWPSVFYVCGSVPILWSLIYSYIGANSPHEHTTISESEKKYILESLPDSSNERKDLKTPWRAIASSVPFWALILVHSTSNWGYYTIALQVPSYFSAAFGLNMKQSGFFAALPYLTSYCSGYVYAWINDWLLRNKYLTRTTLKKLWNSIAHWGEALAVFCLAFAGENEALSVTLLVIGITVSSAYTIGSFSNHMDLAPNFSGTLMGITTTFATITTLSAPLYAGFVVTDIKSLFSWKIVFLTSAAVVFTGNLIFLLFGTAEVEPWNFPPNKTLDSLVTASKEDSLKDGKTEDLESKT